MQLPLDANGKALAIGDLVQLRSGSRAFTVNDFLYGQNSMVEVVWAECGTIRNKFMAAKTLKPWIAPAFPGDAAPSAGVGY